MIFFTFAWDKEPVTSFILLLLLLPDIAKLRHVALSYVLVIFVSIVIELLHFSSLKWFCGYLDAFHIIHGHKYPIEKNCVQ